ncbi:MAG: hypothetical protein INQ03_15590 [Candidatus Heimdallarchaeota archaeon]|nr:hypothetical protein [Candidatus Heimdallarchaeota archaeon]
MRKLNIVLLISVLALLLSGASTSSAALPSGLVVSVDVTHADFLDQHEEATLLEGNLTAAGSTLNMIEDDFVIPADTDVLLISRPDIAWDDANMTEFNDWFTADGAKLVWVAGDSDYGGYFNFDNTNDFLAEIDAKLRVASISVEDPVSSDGSAYRVMPNTTVDDGVLNAKFNAGVTTSVFHGPAAVIAEDASGNIIDLNATDVEGIEVIRKTGKSGVGIDSDFSETKYDFYAGETGNIPMMAIEELGDGKWLIVSGEAIWSDYKQMYGKTTEKGIDTDGKTLVDNILSWFAADGDSDSLFPAEETEGSFLPVAFAPFVIAMATAVVYKKRK